MVLTTGNWILPLCNYVEPWIAWEDLHACEIAHPWQAILRIRRGNITNSSAASNGKWSSTLCPPKPQCRCALRLQKSSPFDNWGLRIFHRGCWNPVSSFFSLPATTSAAMLTSLGPGRSCPLFSIPKCMQSGECDRDSGRF